MADRRHNGHHRRSRSPTPFDDDDADYQLALKLSAELNRHSDGCTEADAGAGAGASKRQAAYDTSFGFAAHLPNVTASSFEETHPGAFRTDPTTQTSKTFATLTEFTDYVKKSQCPGCGNRHFKCESDVSDVFRKWYDGKAALSSLLECRICSERYCIMCPPTAAHLLQESLGMAAYRSVSWCCDSGRLLLIWLLLCGFDSSYCETKAKNTQRAEAMKKNPESSPEYEGKGKGVAMPFQGRGTGYSDDDGFIDYLSSKDLDEFEHEGDSVVDWWNRARESYHEVKAAMREKTLSDGRSGAQKVLDTLGTKVLSSLRDLLPSLDRKRTFDIDPPGLIAELLLESKILSFCSKLLRNNSLDDVGIRNSTYDALLDFVQTISMHSATADLAVFRGKPHQLDSCNLLTQTFHNTHAPSVETAAPIAASLRDLAKLSDQLFKNAEYHKEIYSAEKDQEFLSLCRKISTLWQNVSAHVSTATLQATSSEAPIVSSGGVPAVSEVSDSQIFATHALTTLAKLQIRSAPGRFGRLVSEINTLKTSLPPGIFVRHGESRLDVMKCIIIGPSDTPYEHGIFEFDFYCPAEYPEKPPMVSFKGTGGGRADINPNLYSDGKVCLSLLGTWSGEPWKPRQSTLLQVLVSIQAMIFCEEPWFNEPDRGRIGPNIDASEKYNRRLRELTVRIAMLSWLGHIPEVWDDVVSQHFKSNADTILHTVIEWSKESEPTAFPMFDPSLFTSGTKTGYGEMLPELHRHLQKYGATVVLPEFLKVDKEPQSKKPPVENTYLKNLQDLETQFLQTLLPSSLGIDVNIGEADLDDMKDFDAYYQSIMHAADLGTRGGYSGSSTQDPGENSFRGRGQTADTAPNNASTASSAISDHGRGRGQGSIADWPSARGGASGGQPGMRGAKQGSKHSVARRLSGGDDASNLGGHGGRGGGGSSMT